MLHTRPLDDRLVQSRHGTVPSTDPADLELELYSYLLCSPARAVENRSRQLARGALPVTEDGEALHVLHHEPKHRQWQLEHILLVQPRGLPTRVNKVESRVIPDRQGPSVRPAATREVLHAPLKATVSRSRRCLGADAGVHHLDRGEGT